MSFVNYKTFRELIANISGFNFSYVGQAWRIMIDGFEEWSNLLRHNADTLVSDTVEKLSALITEKRASRKVYFEEHQRISNEVQRVSLRQLIRTSF